MVTRLPSPPHRAHLPDPDAYNLEMAAPDKAFLRELITTLQRELDRRVTVDEARAELLLITPDGSTMSLKVNNGGAVLTTPMSRPALVATVKPAP